MNTIGINLTGLIFLCISLFGFAESQRRDTVSYVEIEFYTEKDNEEISFLLDRVRGAIGITSNSTIDIHLKGETEFMGNESHFIFAVNSDENVWFTAIYGPIEYAFGYDSGDYILKFMNGITRKAGRTGFVFSRLDL